jgi:hypothetical protein
MEKKQIEIDCPHCSTRILVDVRTRQILRSRRPEELDSSGKPLVGEADWESAMGRVQKRDANRDSALDAALEKERDRASRLDGLFEQAKEKLDDDEEETP